MDVYVTSFNSISMVFVQEPVEASLLPACSHLNVRVTVSEDGPQNFKRLLIVPPNARQLNQRIHGAHNPSKTPPPHRRPVQRRDLRRRGRQMTDSLLPRPRSARECGGFSALQPDVLLIRRTSRSII